jgi:DNA-binding protein Fis
MSLGEVEHVLVEMALGSRMAISQIKAAKLLDVSHDVLRYKIEKFGLTHGEE